jgi:hypothetical protein
VINPICYSAVLTIMALSLQHLNKTSTNYNQRVWAGFKGLREKDLNLTGVVDKMAIMRK